MVRGRYKEAASFGQRLIEQHPDWPESWTYMNIAAMLLHTGDEAGYQVVCHQMLKRYAEFEQYDVHERTVKTCLLLSNANDLSQLPLEKFSCFLDDGTASEGFMPWGWATRALFAYRSGNMDLARKHVENSRMNYPSELTEIINSCVMALVHHQQGESPLAEAELNQARKLVARHRHIEESMYSADRLIGEILIREAEGKLKADN
jgi:hypothetical protein